MIATLLRGAGAAALLIVLASCSGTPAAEAPIRDAEPGDCVQNPSGPETTFEAADCDDAETKRKYVILNVIDGQQNCADEPDTDWAISLLSEPVVTACLRLQPEAGECFRASNDQYWGVYHPCEDNGAVISGVVEGDSENACEEGQWGRPYSDGTVLCWDPATFG